MGEYRIAAIGGDGIGPEVVEAGVEVLNAVAERDGGFSLKVETFPWGGDYYRKHGVMMPEDGVETLKPFDAIYFGSAGDPNIPDHITLWGLRLKICQTLDQYANVRPSKLLPGIDGPLKNVKPGDLDWVIVRENSEGEYAGVGGRVHTGLPEEVGMDVAVFTRAGVERIQRFALELARSRPRKKLTLVTKSNAQRHGMVFWDDVFEVVRKDFPDVETDKMLVDAMTTRMVLKPQSLDTIVATNLHADVLSDRDRHLGRIPRQHPGYGRKPGPGAGLQLPVGHLHDLPMPQSIGRDRIQRRRRLSAGCAGRNPDLLFRAEDGAGARHLTSRL